MSTFDKFKKAVREAYLEKQSLNKLHGKINNPSPANLRDYSLIRWTEGLTSDDLIVYKNYYNPLNRYENIEQAIRKVDLNQLKSLQNFIIGETSTRSEEIVKMLAILIDFKKRPYKSADWIDTNNSDSLDESNIDKRDDTSIPIEQKSESGIFIEKPEITLEGKEMGSDTSTLKEGDEGEEKIVEKNEGIQIGKATFKETNTEKVSNERIGDTPPLQIDLKNHQNTNDPLASGLNPSDPQNSNDKLPVMNNEAGNRKTFFGTFEASLASENPDSKNNPLGLAKTDKSHIFIRNKRVYYSYAALILTLFITTGIYSLTSKDCMCWYGDKYIQVDCSAKNQPNMVIALDQNKLENFQKINSKDTLGMEDVGKVWYSKIGNEVEFFTSSGKHPVHIDRSLKAATEHIITTWAGRKSLNLDNKSINTLP